MSFPYEPAKGKIKRTKKGRENAGTNEEFCQKQERRVRIIIITSQWVVITITLTTH